VACTTATLIAATLGLSDISTLKAADVEKIKAAAPAARFPTCNAAGCVRPFGLGPGRSAHPAGGGGARTACDGDTRWINRGAYDLLGSNPGAMRSAAGLPRAGGSVRLAAAAAQEVRLVRLAIGAPASRCARICICTRHAWPTYRACRPKGCWCCVHELPETRDLKSRRSTSGIERSTRPCPFAARRRVRSDRRPRSASADVGYRRRRQPAVAFERIRRPSVAD